MGRFNVIDSSTELRKRSFSSTRRWSCRYRRYEAKLLVERLILSIIMAFFVTSIITHNVITLI